MPRPAVERPSVAVRVSGFSRPLKNKVELLGTSYFFDTFEIEIGGELVVDESAGPIVIYVRDQLRHDGITTSASTPAAQPTIGYFGWLLGANITNSFRGKVIAPRALLTLGPLLGGGTFEGAFFAKDLFVRSHATVRALD